MVMRTSAAASGVMLLVFGLSPAPKHFSDPLDVVNDKDRGRRDCGPGPKQVAAVGAGAPGPSRGVGELAAQVAFACLDPAPRHARPEFSRTDHFEPGRPEGVSSRCVRGARALSGGASRAGRLIPALAGNTSARRVRPHRFWSRSSITGRRSVQTIYWSLVSAPVCSPC